MGIELFIRDNCSTGDLPILIPKHLKKPVKQTIPLPPNPFNETMSLHKKFSSSPPPTTDLRHRVITYLNKLSDRDTLSLASSELESIARTLTPDSFSPFLNCIHQIDSSSRSPVRAKSVNLLTVLINSHGDSLSSLLPKIVSTVQRRLRDPDSAVRSACVEACTAMSVQITTPPFSVISKPLIDWLVAEQDVNSQVGAAMCLAASIKVTPNPDKEQLRKLLPRLGKLMRNQGFKAKAAVLAVIRSIVEVGGARSKGVLDSLVPCMLEFLSSDDWGSRKAAAEVLEKLAIAEEDLVKEYKTACVTALESRRFDKVKVVRETMNHALELWKEVPGVEEQQVSVPSLPRSSSASTDNANVSSTYKHSDGAGFKTPIGKKTIPTTSRSPSPDAIVTIDNKHTPISTHSSSSKAYIHKLNHQKSCESRIEIAGPKRSLSTADYQDDSRQQEDKALESIDNTVNDVKLKAKTKHIKIHKNKIHEFGSLRSMSRVVPFNVEGNHCSDDLADKDRKGIYLNNTDAEDLSLIREQLFQIENQQSNLLDILQKFIGNSQNGINSLETRVNGLERALDEISYDLAVSTGRIHNPDSSDSTCCRLPGAEFLSPKFWRNTEGQYSTSRYVASGSSMLKEAGGEMYKLENEIFQPTSRGGNPGIYSNCTSKRKIPNLGTSQFHGIHGH